LSRVRTLDDTEPNTTVNLVGYGPARSCTNPYGVVPNALYNLTETFCARSKVITTTDEVTPNFHRQVNAGLIVMNPYTHVEESYEREPIDWYEARFLLQPLCAGGSMRIELGQRRVGLRSPSVVLGSTFLAAPVLGTQSAIDQAVTAAYAKVSEQDAQGLVILAEGQKTINSFISIFKRLIRIGRALKKWDVGYLRKQLSARELSDRWMEGRYAVRPVVYDMYDIVKAMKRVREKHPFRKTYRSGASASDTVSQTGVVVAVSNPQGLWNIKAQKTATSSVSVRSGVLTAVREITEATIWGLNQPFNALWELVPFSFVVDWFLNVGKTIASWSPAWGINTLASWATVDQTVLQTIQTESATNLWGWPLNCWESAIVATNGYVYKTTRTRTRMINPNLPILPTWNVRLDAAKLLDLAIMGKRFFI